MKYRRAVRPLTLSLVVIAHIAGCAQHPGTDASASSAVASSASSSGPSPVDPDRLKRVRGELPSGYEVGEADGTASPAQFWGFPTGWVADPPLCAPLLDPIADPVSAHGLSGSGTGGIIYVVVLTVRSGTLAPEPGLIGECGQWSLGYDRSTATVSLTDAPRIDGAETVGMSTAIRTVVEAGTETNAQAHTATAYLGSNAVFVTVITDPGSPDPPLPPQYAAELLVKAVSALRG